MSKKKVCTRCMVLRVALVFGVIVALFMIKGLTGFLA